MGRGGQHVKQSEHYHQWRLRHLHPARPPEVILSSWSVTQFDQADLERARWVWERRPKRRFSAKFWLWLACSLAPAVAAPFLHLPQPFGDVLVDGSFVASCVLVFLSSRESDEWARWRADYSRAIEATGVHGVDLSWLNGNYQLAVFH
jgi:hypothetical protein